MEQPSTLDELIDTVANHPEIIAAMKRGGHATAAALLASGELEDAIDNDYAYGASIPARGAEGDTIEVRIFSFGGLYWISVNEFDDIGYFTSEQAALDYAHVEYEDLINADDDEEYDEDEDEEEEEDEEQDDEK